MVRLTQTSVLVLALSLPVVTGCGPDYGPMGAISGKLTMNGEVLPAGTKVLFMHPTTGHAGFGMTDEAGNYSIEWRKESRTLNGLPAGKYQVMIVAADTVEVDELSADEMLEGGASKAGKSKSIPAKYYRASTSGLEYDVNEGDNEINIDLSST